MKTLIFFIACMVFSPFQNDEITIFLVSDSTVADKPYENGNPEKGWGQVFPLYFKKGVSIQNHAVNGRSTKSFMDEGRWKNVLNAIKPGDYVFIEFGHNDEKVNDSTRYADPDGLFRKNLIQYVTEAREREAIPILLTPIVRRKFNENGELEATHGKYPDVVRQVSASMKVPLIDLTEMTRSLVTSYGAENSKKLFLHITPGEYEHLPEGRQDDTHLSAVGAFRISDLVVSGIRKSIPQLEIYLKE